MRELKINTTIGKALLLAKGLYSPMMPHLVPRLGAGSRSRAGDGGGAGRDIDPVEQCQKSVTVLIVCFSIILFGSG